MAERRNRSRITLELPVDLAHGLGSIATRSYNVGVGGMFIATDAPLPCGTAVVVSFLVPGGTEVLSIPAVVRWGCEEGIGVQFTRMRAMHVWHLNRLLERHAGAGPRPAVAVRPAAEA